MRYMMLIHVDPITAPEPDDALFEPSTPTTSAMPFAAICSPNSAGTRRRAWYSSARPN